MWIEGHLRPWWADRLGDEGGRLAHPRFYPPMDEATAIRRFCAQGAHSDAARGVAEPSGPRRWRSGNLKGGWFITTPPAAVAAAMSLSCTGSWRRQRRRRPWPGGVPTSRETVRAAARPRPGGGLAGGYRCWAFAVTGGPYKGRLGMSSLEAPYGCPA